MNPLFGQIKGRFAFKKFICSSKVVGYLVASKYARIIVALREIPI